MYPPIYRADDGTLLFHLHDHVVSIDPSDPARMPGFTHGPLPESRVELRPMPTIQEMRDLVGEDLPDPDPLDPAHLRWAGKLLAAFDTPNAQYNSGDFFDAADSLEEEIDAADSLEEEIVVQVEAMAKAIFAPTMTMTTPESWDAVPESRRHECLAAARAALSALRPCCSDQRRRIRRRRGPAVSAAEKWVRCLVRTARVVRGPDLVDVQYQPLTGSTPPRLVPAVRNGMLYTRWRASDTEKYSHFWVPLTAVVSIEERD